MSEELVALDCTVPIWDRFYLVRPLVIVGTVEPDGGVDFAPKHMAGPASWQNFYSFVCCDDHATYKNVVRTGEFTISYPTPGQIIETSLTGAPQSEDDTKANLIAVPMVPATVIDGALVRGARIHLECKLERMIDGIGANNIVVGRIVAASVDERALRGLDREDAHAVSDAPILAYLQPNRFAVVDESRSFPFYSRWSR